MPNNCTTSPEQNGMFNRTMDLLGEEGFQALRNSFVVVVGLGGVGSHASLALVRSGVGKLRLIDFDHITWSTLNRHATATASDVHKPKAVILKNQLQKVCPDLQVETNQTFLDSTNVSDLLAGNPDFVVDAIDSMAPKTTLLRFCVTKGIPVVSSMGAALRADPTSVRISDINDTHTCPLARRLRKSLSKSGISNGVACVYSTEPPVSPLPPDESEGTLKRGRIRNRLPSLGTIPGIMGYAAASIVITEIANYAKSSRSAPP